MSRKEAVILEGCRRVGKTSLLLLMARKVLDSGGRLLFLDLEDPDDLEIAAGGPGDVQKLLGGPGTVFLDEMHHLQDIGRFIKLAVDHHPEMKLVCTGSSSVRFLRRSSDSLIGRTVEFEVWPLGFREFLEFRQERTLALMDRAIDLVPGGEGVEPGSSSPERDWRVTEHLMSLFSEYAFYGGFPEIALIDDPVMRQKLLGQMFRVYALRDLKELFEIRREPSFRKFFTALAATIGGEFKQSELAAEIGVSAKTARRYLEILEALYLIKVVRPYLRNPRSEIRKLPKVYFVDSGLLAWTMGWHHGTGSSAPADIGRLVENIMSSALGRNLPEGAQLHFWRTRGGAEVDFVVAAGNTTLPVEVKWRMRRTLPRGLRRFIETYRPTRALLATRETAAVQQLDDTRIELVPVARLA